MKDLRERAEKLMAHWNTQEIEDNRKNMTGDLEAFAREIRNEALEDAMFEIRAQAIYDEKTGARYAKYFQEACLVEIRALRTDALAATEVKK